VSIRNWEDEEEDRKKREAGWVLNEKTGRYVPPKGEQKFSPMKTSDPDYYAESLLYEIKSAHDSVIECFKELKKQLTVIEEHLMAIRKRVRKK
jgi:hypothetical protein